MQDEKITNEDDFWDDVKTTNLKYNIIIQVHQCTSVFKSRRMILPTT
jgi:hypothetical protein